MIKNESERTGLLFNSPRPKLRSKGKMDHLELIRLEQQRVAKIRKLTFLSFLVSDELASQPHSSEKLADPATPRGGILQGAVPELGSLASPAKTGLMEAFPKGFPFPTFLFKEPKRHSTLTHWLR